MTQIDLLLTKERVIRETEKYIYEYLKNFDQDSKIRILTGLLLAEMEKEPPKEKMDVEEQKVIKINAKSVGPTARILHVFQQSDSKELTANQILFKLQKLYPEVEHSYVHQVLSRSVRREGVFRRNRKDLETKQWLYYLQYNPPEINK